MESNVMNLPAMDLTVRNAWLLPTAAACAAGASAVLTASVIDGAAARAQRAIAPFGAVAGAVVTAERGFAYATTGHGKRGSAAAAPGDRAWSTTI